MILDGFNDVEDLKRNYAIEDEYLKDYEILFACYESGGYDGHSVIILKKHDKYFISEASHCSCYGLEGQFHPYETTDKLLLEEAKTKTKWWSDHYKFIEFVNDYFKE